MRFRRIACAVVPLVLAAALAALWLVRSPKVSASLYDLIGREAERIPKFLREASSAEAAVIVSSADAEKANRVAEELAALSGVSVGDLPPGAVDFIRENRGGLVTRETAGLLATAEGRAKLAKRAMRRLYMSPVPPVLGFRDDPFGLTDAYLMSLSGNAPGGRRTVKGRFPVLVTNGVTRVLVKFRVDRSAAESLDGAVAWAATWREAARRASSSDVEVRIAGAPVHTALSAAKSKSEIGFLTWFSLAFIAALSLVVFRSWRWIPLLASSLAVSALAGGVALVAAFDDIHVMTFVMGTTVLGLVIDYSFHWLLSPAEDRPSVRRNLLVSFLTTEISLVPLMLATIPVLRQSAVFLGVGLAAALAYVLCCYPTEAPVSHATGMSRPLCWSRAQRGRDILVACLGGSIVLVLVAGICRLTVRTEIAALYHPPAELLEAERQRASFGEFDFSAIPALEERRGVAADVERLYAEHGDEMARTLELEALVPPSVPTEDLPRPQTLMEEIFATWTADALVRLGLSVLALLVALTVLCRRRAPAILYPSLTAIVAVAGAVSWTGAPVNLFHILAMFLLLGMGIDYAVFLQSGNGSAFRPALSSLLTSMAGFGALAFVSFPVVASFGLVLGVGLPVAFGLALLGGRGVRAAAPNKEDAASVERAASPIGLEILWLLYRVFGLRVLHFLAEAVGLCVWTCSPAVRRASPSFRKVAQFTSSLADKLVVMAEGSRLPKVETDGSADAEAFLTDVRTGKGVFILSSHVGTIEVLTALGECDRTFHAWMDFDRTGVFNGFYLRHARRRRVVIHPISSFGMGTVFEAGDLIDNGDCLVMAGDRGDGAFRFAAAFGHPVYFVACLAAGSCRYRAIVRRLPSDRREMKAEYESHLRRVAAACPTQHFVWTA